MSSQRSFALATGSDRCGGRVQAGEAVIGDTLLHPVAITAVLVLLLNDHFWKGVGPAWLTGKLSDLAGLVFFPLLLEAIVELVAAAALHRWPRTRPGWLLPLCCALTAIAFASIKLWPPAAWAYCHAGGAIQWPFRSLMSWLTGAGDALAPLRPLVLVMDATDLVALPSVLVAWLTTRR